MLRTLRDLDLAGKRVLLRVEFNVPLEGTRIVEDTRIAASLPTFRWLLEAGASLGVVTHLGRPGGTVVEELRVEPLAARLAGLLRKEVRVAPGVVGDEVKAVVRGL